MYINLRKFEMHKKKKEITDLLIRNTEVIGMICISKASLKRRGPVCSISLGIQILSLQRQKFGLKKKTQINTTEQSIIPPK